MRALLRRVLASLFGLVLFSAYLGVLWLIVRSPFRVSQILVFLGLSFIGLFGLNLVLQSVLGRSDQEGFFYWGLERLKGVSPIWISLGIPLFLLASVLCSLVFGPREELMLSTSLLVGWLMLLAHLAVHEWGHFAAGRGAGLEIHRVVIGPLELRSTAMGWRSGLCRDWISIGSGLVETDSTRGTASPQQILKLAAGGPFATLLALVVLLYFNPYSYLQLLRVPGGLVGPFFAAGIFLGVFVLVANLIPIRGGPCGMASDGYRILEAIRTLRETRA